MLLTARRGNPWVLRLVFPAALAALLPASFALASPGAMAVTRPPAAQPLGLAVSVGALGLRDSWKGRQLFQREATSPAFALETTFDVWSGGDRAPTLALGLGAFFENEENAEVAGYHQRTTLATRSGYATAAVRLPVGGRLWPYFALAGGVSWARAELGWRPLESDALSVFGRATLGLRVEVMSRGALRVAIGAEGGLVVGTPFEFSLSPASPEGEDDRAEDPIATASVDLGELPNLRGYGGLHLLLMF